ncbi:hypothetical protein KSS87_021504 [Heliosperma pusillum]|nr:hypothetical protein KSS87_021504 [Heliosperma pusillum]
MRPLLTHTTVTISFLYRPTHDYSQSRSPFILPVRHHRPPYNVAGKIRRCRRTTSGQLNYRCTSSNHFRCIRRSYLQRHSPVDLSSIGEVEGFIYSFMSIDGEK